VKGLSQEEKEKTRQPQEQILAEIKPYTLEVDAHTIPGLGLHPGFAPKAQFQIPILGDSLIKVAAKMVRGCQFWRSNGRVVDPLRA
jgi:hypothetical protein